MNKKTHILLAEDETALGQILKESLETRDFVVQLCHNGEEAFELYQANQPDVLVLDVMMPKKDGFTLAQQIRKNDDDTPIIFLTAKSQPHDVVMGFNTGGNDYLKKPFSIEELIVRIKNLLNNRKTPNKNNDILIGHYMFSPKNQTLQYREEKKETLTSRESQLLLYLARHKNDTIDRNVVLAQLWGNSDFYSARSMDVFISKLRKRLSKDKSIKILNVRGVGYKLVV
ncbi:response regulator transcription factor [Flavobacterium luminosum]|uniref:Response regulator transcription factor n=1 Tax=Flavobacterium luminosum TaxID=2949086 RepID=A0ABT0TJS0_9FLAO|nr:response regulator transcription factor [Flavobacterium sp. HXWNR70]MCL9807752.1 response regulator transcription factor [Flavobacterium sp. HXWNR70]